MPRQPRIEFEDAVYHVMARGNRREAIFLDDQDRGLFLRTFGEACERTGFRVYAWVLMPNHYHAVIRTPNANLVEGMAWLQNTYTRRFNARHRKWGRLFGDRYKSIVVEDVAGSRSSRRGDYLMALIEYVHLNPARARLIRPRREESILDYPWSSVAQGYALGPRKRARWMDIEGGLELYDLEDSARDRRRYVARLDERAGAEEAERCGLAEFEGQSLQSTLRRGWYWGSQSFGEKMLDLVERRGGNGSSNRNYRSSAQGSDRCRREAQRILAEGVAHFGLPGPASLRKLGRGDRRRVAIAWALWRKTAMPQQWIAGQTGFKTPANVSQQVRRYELVPGGKLPPKERKWKEAMLGVG